MFSTTGITRKLHTVTLVNVLLLGVTVVGLVLALRGLNRAYAELNDLHDQRSSVSALGDLTSETMLLLERAIYKNDRTDLSTVLAWSEDLQSAFSHSRDAASTHHFLEDESFAAEAEPTIYALRNDIVKCASLLREGRQQDAQSHFSNVLRHRADPIERFVESSVYSKDVQIEERTKDLASLQRSMVWIATAIILGMVGLVAMINTKLGASMTKPLDSLIQATRRVAAGDWAASAVVSSHDEIGELAESFNAMVAERARATAALQSAVAGLEIAKLDAEAANHSKSEFLANMSHEIRTPMTAILGFTESLFDTSLSDSERLNALQTIHRNGEHLLEVINDILDISKVEAGKLQVEHLTCSPVQIVAEVKSLMQVRADAQGLPLNTEFIGAVPETIESDPTRLRQILMNLIGNAIKFTETGGVRLITRYVNTDRGPAEPMMQFDIVDTGIGISKEQVGKLFQPFAQVDSSTSRKFGGTGLGLSISKRLAKLLGGDIAIESTPGEGSTFRVTVTAGPLDGVKMLADPAAATIVQPEPTGAASRRAPSKLDCRILLAEDGPDNQRLISFVLKKAGADVTVKENGKLALDAALAAREEGNPFDVILMDIQMPVMDGYTATRQLRKKGYSGPIIALTAHAMAGDREKCISAGCDEYLTKPINRTKLIDLIARQAWRADAAA